jgi:DNA-binding transcriptional LysR family regulator
MLAQAISLALAELRQGIVELREQRRLVDGPISVGCLPLARTYLLPAAVTRFLGIYPDIKMRIADGPYSELLHEMRHGRLDLIVGALRSPAPSADIKQELLFSDQLSIVVRSGHPIIAEALPTPERLARLEWIVSHEEAPSRAQFSRFFDKAGVAMPSRLIVCSSLAAVRGLLIQSDRASLLSAAQVRYEVKLGLLGVLPTPIPGTSYPIGIAMRRDWQPTAVQAHFLTLLREVMDRSGIEDTATLGLLRPLAPAYRSRA